VQFGTFGARVDRPTLRGLLTRPRPLAALRRRLRISTVRVGPRPTLAPSSSYGIGRFYLERLLS